MYAKAALEGAALILCLRQLVLRAETRAGVGMQYDLFAEGFAVDEQFHAGCVGVAAH